MVTSSSASLGLNPRALHDHSRDIAARHGLCGHPEASHDRGASSGLGVTYQKRRQGETSAHVVKMARIALRSRARAQDKHASPGRRP
jgi:hypothetical protein